MDYAVIAKLMLLSLSTILLSLCCYMLKRATAFGRLSDRLKQVLIGIAFGISAIIGTQFGADTGSSLANVRDAAPVCAGLFFGPYAGVISGIIGGGFRWISVAFGGGMYTRTACSLSAVLAGMIAGWLRIVMFEDKRPGAVFSFIIAAAIEVLHLTLILLTHLNDSAYAFEIVKEISVPMIFCNAAAVMISGLLISYHSRTLFRKDRYPRLSQVIQSPLLISVIIAYIASASLIYSLQTNTAINDSADVIQLALSNISDDILRESDESLLDLARDIADELNEDMDADLNDLCEEYEVALVFIVDENGIVVQSSVDGIVGYDLASDKDLPYAERQSSLFLVLLEDGVKEYVQQLKPLASNPDITMKLAGVKLEDGGFVQVGYDQQMFSEGLRNEIKVFGTHRHIGQRGYVIITDEKYRIVSDQPEYDHVLLSSKGLDLELYEKEKLNRIEYAGDTLYMLMTESEGFIIAGFLPQEEVFESRDNMFVMYSFMAVLLYSVLFGLIYYVINRSIVRNIHKVNGGLSSITGGSLDTKVDVRFCEEFAMLSDEINSTVDTLKRYIDEEAQRLDQELVLAKDIQYSALPSVFPAFPARDEFDIYASMNAAKKVGGDFYDFYFIDHNRIAVLAADVSGKGIPAAMFMMKAKSIIKDLAEMNLPVNEVFTRANEKLCEGNDAGMFVTAWMGIIDLENGHVCYANAGHNPPVVIRHGKRPEYLRSKAGFVLAGMEGMQYAMQEFDLSVGDRLYLYTDGVTEAENCSEQQYGTKRLQKFIAEHAELSAKEMLEGIKADIDVFADGAEQFDDMTMLMFDLKKLNPAQISTERIFDAKVEELRNALAFAEELMEKADVPMKVMMKISVAFEEVFVNIAHYAYPDRDGYAKVSVAIADHTVTIRFRDNGIPFNPLKQKAPDITLPAEEREIGGLGIYMVIKSMDGIGYEYSNGENVFVMRKHYE